MRQSSAPCATFEDRMFCMLLNGSLPAPCIAAANVAFAGWVHSVKELGESSGGRDPDWLTQASRCRRSQKTSQKTSQTLTNPTCFSPRTAFPSFRASLGGCLGRHQHPMQGERPHPRHKVLTARSQGHRTQEQNYCFLRVRRLGFSCLFRR